MSASQLQALESLVLDNLASVPDFPEPGVLFRDMTPLLANGKAFGQVIDGISNYYRGKIDAVAGLESRGFLLAAPVACQLGLGTIVIRKAGKLPGPVIGRDYGLEYGQARMEIQPSSVKPGDRVLVLDDVLATGGTARASAELIAASGGEVVSICVLMELAQLEGRKKIAGIDCQALTVLQAHEEG